MLLSANFRPVVVSTMPFTRTLPVPKVMSPDAVEMSAPSRVPSAMSAGPTSPWLSLTKSELLTWGLKAAVVWIEVSANPIPRLVLKKLALLCSVVSNNPFTYTLPGPKSTSPDVVEMSAPVSEKSRMSLGPTSLASSLT